MKKRFDRSGTARRKAVTAIAALTMALVLAVGGAGAATLLSAQPETLTVGAVVPHITAEAPQTSSPAPADPAPAAESTATAPEQTAESTAQLQQAESVPEQAEKPETAETAPAEPEEAAAAPETPETPAQPAGDAALEEENSPAMLLEETPELAAQDPQAPAADGTAQNDTAAQHTPEGSVLLTPEQIQQALDSGALEDAEAQEEADGCNWALNGRMLDYPIFYDTEASTAPRGTGRADGLGVEDRTKCAIAFCERVKELGYKPGVYASTTWYRKRVDYNTLRSRYTIWNAHYGVSSSPIGCDMWQGTRTAHINGYSGELDANISYIG